MAKNKNYPKFSPKNKRSYWIGYGIALGQDRRVENGRHRSKGFELMNAYQRRSDIHLNKGYERYQKDKHSQHLVMTRLESPKKASKLERDRHKQKK